MNDRRTAARSRVFLCGGTCSAASRGERAGARVVSSDKEVTNCLTRRAPGRPLDVLGTKLARRDRPVRSAWIVTKRRQVSIRAPVDRDLRNNANAEQVGPRTIENLLTGIRASGSARSFGIISVFEDSDSVIVSMRIRGLLVAVEYFELKNV